MTSIQTDAVSFYSKVAEEFHNSYRTDSNRQERLRIWRSYLDRYATGTKCAYDVGCGSGILACDLASRGIETVGIDGASAMLTIAKNTADMAGLTKITFQQHRLPIADASKFDPADIVISSSAIEYLDSIHDALVCLRNLLKPNGVVLFSVSNRDSWSRAAVRLVHRVSGYPVYVGLLKHFMTIDEILVELEAAELSYIEHSFFARADRINHILGHFLPPRMSSNMILVAARSRS